MSFATVAAVAALVALLLSAAGLMAESSPAAASTAAPTPAPTAARAPAAAAPASTDPPSSTPSPPPTAQPLALDRLPSGLVTTFPLTVAGSGTPGDVVSVSGGSSPSASESCQATVRDDGRWSCALASLPDGPKVAVRADAGPGGSDADQVKVLHPPVIAGSGVVPTTGGVRGTAYPGASVTVTADTGASCTFPADSNGNWGCVLSADLTDGRHAITATQVADFSSQRSATSAAVAIDVDRTSPSAPSITTPTGGSASPGTPLAFGGAGETGAHITLYASTARGAAVVCTADVVAGGWSCQGALDAGTYTLSALQRDAAGNVSAGSNAVTLTVAAGSAVRAPPPTRTPTPTPSPTTPAPVAPGAAPPAGPPHPETRGWVDVPFTTASAPTVTADALPGWMRSVGLAVAALLLLVLPARLLAAALARGRADRGRHSERASLFGRNRPRSELSDASALFGRTPTASTSPTPSPATGLTQPATGLQSLWPTVVAGAVASLLVTLSAPVPDAGAYPGVLVAVALAVAAVNAVWVLAGRGLAAHLHLPMPRVTLHPGLLVVVAVAAIGSRLLELSPALLFALVLTLTLGPEAGRVRQGRIAAVQVSAVAALGVLAWLAVGLFAAPTNPVTVFLAELVNVLALAGIGSAAVMLLPIGGLAGRAIVQWSRWLWAGLSLVVYTVLFALLLPVASLVERGVGVVVVVGAAVGFAATSVAFWLWERFVAPALDRTIP
ncbi:Ig-like domain-containing protein [Leifsonia sp. 2MCAF36]|uniref:Ig-like domain-containing protein n=1 Tax=Leifsonia sp. 2MCAF36 TaxID=3232988 RepID=UPI003F95253D